MIVVVPLAGRGSRFADSQPLIPKPLIPVAGRPIVAHALDSLSGLCPKRIVFVALKEHDSRFGISTLLKNLAGAKAEIVLLDSVTEGQLCTVLAAREFIEPAERLLIASSDTYVVSDLARDITNCDATCHGLISVTNAPGDQWSFARVDAAGDVVEVAEKIRISDYASTGLYYFSHAGEFLEIADDIVQNREKTKGEYYVMPIYGKYVERGWRVRLSLAGVMWDMGTPAALGVFERYLRSAGMGAS